MKKYQLLLLCAIIMHFSPTIPMDEEEGVEMGNFVINLPDGPSVDRILRVSDPVKFAILAQQLAGRPVGEVHKKRRAKKQVSKEQELQLLLQSMEEVSDLNNGTLTGLDTLSQQALQRWNIERTKGLGWAVGWGLSTAALLGIEGYVIFSDLSTEAKIATGVPLATAALGTILKFLDNSKKTINNEHINEKLEVQLKKAKTVQATKKNLAKDIERLKKEIAKERRGRVRDIEGEGSIMRKSKKNKITSRMTTLTDEGSSDE